MSLFRALSILCLFALGLPIAAQAQDGVVILSYHRFGEGDVPSTNIETGQFEKHLQMLTSGRYTVLPLSDILDAFEQGKPLPANTVAITIDDGYASVFKEAHPRLKKAGLPYTLFVSTEVHENPGKTYMSWAQIQQLAAEGVEIGHHSHSHMHMIGQSAATLQKDLATAAAIFRDKLGKVPDLFAWPYGEFDLPEQKVLQEAGFRAAFAQYSSVAHSGSDRFALPRFALNERYGDEKRVALILKAQPIIVNALAPASPLIQEGDANPPTLTLTVNDPYVDLEALTCYASGDLNALSLEIENRTVRMTPAEAFPAGRSRINCTLPELDGSWRWFGRPFFKAPFSE